MRQGLLLGTETLINTIAGAAPSDGAHFDGLYFRGTGDAAYLELLDTSYRLLWPSPNLQSLAMLYTPDWNGFVEGPTWGAWWIQNSYGPTFCGLPFFEEPYTTFVQNAQDLWFSHMGDGLRKDNNGYVGPPGCLCDAANPQGVWYRQGDGRVEIHDWGMEFTAAGIVMQAEALLVRRDLAATLRYLPLLEKAADFIESRRDPKNNLFLAGPAGNLLAPSYAGWKHPDGTYHKAYLAGLSITTIAALDRLVELEKLAGRHQQAELYAGRRELARRGLPELTTEEGYFVKSIDPDGTRHGVYGAARHGYFEAVCNHDAIAFGVAPIQQAERIYQKIAAIPGLRPHDMIITNYPSLDDMYEAPEGLWRFGEWVNGGVWTTCDARMILAYFRLGKHADARRAMERILDFARRFRMDNNLTDFGAQVYQPNQPINCVYDSWGAPLAMLRGLFGYRYTSEGLWLHPSIPAGITSLEQRFPVRFGTKRLFIRAVGSGPVTAAYVERRRWTHVRDGQVLLPYEELPERALVTLCLGGEKAPDHRRAPAANLPPAPAPGGRFYRMGAADTAHEELLARVGEFYNRARAAGLADTYEGRHALLVVETLAAARQRKLGLRSGQIAPLPGPSEAAADASYLESAQRLAQGLQAVLEGYTGKAAPARARLADLWRESAR